jgi:exopolysaccharide biosynthesis polyprenyl glycosylphosphotransferase
VDVASTRGSAVRLALLEGLVIFASVAGSIFVWRPYRLVDWTDIGIMLGEALVLAGCCIVAFYYSDLYDLRAVRSLRQWAPRLVQALGFTLILLAGAYTLFPDMRLANDTFLSSLALIVGLVLPVRAAGYGLMRRRAFADRVLILGTGPLARKLIAEIETRPHLGYIIVGIADDGGSPDAEALPCPLLGPLEHVGKIAEELRADRIIVAMTERRGRMPTGQLLEAEARGILVDDGLETYEHFTGKLAIEALTPSHLIFSKAFRKSRLQLGLRRLVSLAAAAIGLALSAPLMALIALAIKLDSRGPVFFVQERGGLGGRPFRLVKFRTMTAQCDSTAEHVWRRDDRARITRVGRLLRRPRLDEWPQFWNILRGDMDLVGPRPEILVNVKTMAEEIPYFAFRHLVRPGITGWAQIRYNYSVSVEEVTEKVRYDLYYVKHMSVWLDLRILVDTVKIVLTGEGQDRRCS